MLMIALDIHLPVDVKLTGLEFPAFCLASSFSLHKANTFAIFESTETFLNRFSRIGTCTSSISLTTL